MRAEIDRLVRRAGQLELSVGNKDSQIASQIAQSQEHVAESERIARLLTSATTAEQLEKLGAESNRVSSKLWIGMHVSAFIDIGSSYCSVSASPKTVLGI